jgi:2-(1,2-epoxy-1,2-dihydrophenyl)acetyl-CoA isomerase
MRLTPSIPPGLVVDHDGPVLRVRLDRPDRRNSLTDAMVYALAEIVDAAGSDESVRVVLLSGSGEHFCSGFDLGERESGPLKPRVGSIHRRMSGHVNRLIPTMLTTQTPIVCTARGWVIGLGLNLALAADFAIVADDARLWAPFANFGFTPDSGASWLLPRLAGLARAKDMLLLGTKVSGGEAASWGLVHRAVPAADLDAAGDELVGRLAAGATVALGLTKLLVHRAISADIERHLDDEAWAMEVSSRSEDFKEYSRATRERREPKFQGR